MFNALNPCRNFQNASLEEEKSAHQPSKGKPLNFERFQRKKLGVGRPRNVDRIGHVPGNPNRRTRITEFARKRGPKPKIRGVFSGVGGLQVSY